MTLEKEKSNNTLKGDLIKSGLFITSTMGVSYKLKLGKSYLNLYDEQRTKEKLY